VLSRHNHRDLLFTLQLQNTLLPHNPSNSLGLWGIMTAQLHNALGIMTAPLHNALTAQLHSALLPHNPFTILNNKVGTLMRQQEESA
jgi:hypothetical protein